VSENIDDGSERQRSDAARAAAEVLDALDDIAVPLRKELSEPMLLPEPAVTLDLASRKGDRTRSVKHVHQHCVMHWMQYRRATEMKVVHLIDAFEILAAAGNGLALYPIARSALELYAQVFDVSTRLVKARSNMTSQSWLPGGEEFFKAIVRARFATANEEHRRALSEDGASKKTLEPMSAGQSIRLLGEDLAARDASGRYDRLCDAVHHNLGASTAVTAGSGTASSIMNANGGGFLAPDGKQMTVTGYGYPVVWKSDLVVSRIGMDFVGDVRSTLELLDRSPETPFTPQLLVEFTGDVSGGMLLRRRPDGSVVIPPARSTKHARNEPCSCGSGSKFKHCCGA
jgi:hypothetical protein